MIEYAIETEGLGKRFGRRWAVQDLDLRVPKGSVYAFLGRNGAGKSTTIRMLLNLMDIDRGSAMVLRLDSVKDSLEIKRRTGFVEADEPLYGWMTVDQIIWFSSQFYDTWDVGFADELKRKMELNGSQKISQLSRGQKGRVALLLALAFRPDLLLLDEPMSGLDVIVRHDVLKGVIELIQEENRTILFSTHQVQEVERVADWVGIIDEGRLIRSCPVEVLKQSVKQLVLSFPAAPPALTSLPGLKSVTVSGRQAVVVVDSFNDQTPALAKAAGASAITVQDLNLEQILIHLVQPELVK